MADKKNFTTLVLTPRGSWIFSGASAAPSRLPTLPSRPPQAVRRDVLVSLTSEVARNYFELRGLQNEMAVLRRNADNQNETLKITQSRLEAGSGTDLDVARARAQLNITLAAIPPAESAIAHAIHRLGVLTGQQPLALTGELETPAPPPQLPEMVAIGNPEQLLRRRPDIRAAERNLAASTAGIGVAVADLFPRVTFNGAVGLQAMSFTGLGGPASDTRSFGPAITWAAWTSAMCARASRPPAPEPPPPWRNMKKQY